MLTFPSAPTTTTCGIRHKASTNSESQPSSSEAKTQLTFLKSQPTLPVRDVTHHLVPTSIWDFYFDISEWHILPAHAWTPALMLHLTNPCAKRKVLSLTKLKGKIYKTKSLGHYITPGPLWPGVVVPFTVPFIGQIELSNYLQYLKLFNCVQTIY